MKDKIKEIRYQQQINKLENENETLKAIIKEELYQEFMDYVDVRTRCEKLEETNKRLRSKIKDYQSKTYKGGKK
ncbi:MAG: hypothetical protein IJI98_11065 [Methanosphaera sp.]|nr:hypothetical protein [Methanobrevibacter sp.]MBQ6754222.1 hypothetical protein [Bacteroidales bacterium]MBR0351334.1 hypothetical protein [Clostridia bacterium]MBR0473219.1 hypothetical protein [Methanosphaera sp.]